MVVQLLSAASEACPPGAPARLVGAPGSVRGVPAAVLAKEAAYQAVAAGAYELHDYIDFTGFLHSSLLPEMGDTSPAARPLRRRAIKLVAHWAPRLKKEDRLAVYRALVVALADEDAALQLAAVGTLRALVDDWCARLAGVGQARVIALGVHAGCSCCCCCCCWGHLRTVALPFPPRPTALSAFDPPAALSRRHTHQPHTQGIWGGSVPGLVVP